MGKRKKPFTNKEHDEFGKAIGEVTKILSPYMEKLWQGYGVRHQSAINLQRALHLISYKLCNEMDKEWYKLLNDGDDATRNPYYGPHKDSWMKP